MTDNELMYLLKHSNMEVVPVNDSYYIKVDQIRFTRKGDDFSIDFLSKGKSAYNTQIVHIQSDEMLFINANFLMGCKWGDV